MGTIYYIPEPLTLTANISGYVEGDYAVVYANGGSGDIDWDTIHDDREIDLTDNKWTTLGWGTMPWGTGAWGTGYTEMQILALADAPGLWAFGFKTFGSLDNVNTGTPGEATKYMTPRPKKPGAMAQNSYDSVNDILTLTVAT